jgi:hypothetical protein
MSFGKKADHPGRKISLVKVLVLFIRVDQGRFSASVSYPK